jgi:hypothetical protein
MNIGKIRIAVCQDEENQIEYYRIIKPDPNYFSGWLNENLVCILPTLT